MSFQSWQKEFYPKPADRTSKASATAHSLQKWLGLTKKNLKKHQCKMVYGRVLSESGGGLDIDAASCALCHHYFHYDRNDCGKCPLYLVRGSVKCDHTMATEERDPYGLGTNCDGGAPSRMIFWLRKAVQFSQKKVTRGKK